MYKLEEVAAPAAFSFPCWKRAGEVAQLLLPFALFIGPNPSHFGAAKRQDPGYNISNSKAPCRLVAMHWS